MKLNYYDANADEFFSGTVSVDMTHLYEKFLRYLTTGDRILDAGCGSGRDALAFKNAGFDVDAFDASIEMVNRACDYTGLNIVHAQFDNFDYPHLYDGIWTCASLLHVPDTSLSKTMKVLYDALKRGGVWYISFKYGEGERESHGRRFTDKSEASLRSLLSPLENVLVDEMWVSEDVRPDRTERWLNAIVCKS